jgi:hypothetical protein
MSSGPVNRRVSLLPFLYCCVTVSAATLFAIPAPLVARETKKQISGTGCERDPSKLPTNVSDIVNKGHSVTPNLFSLIHHFPSSLQTAHDACLIFVMVWQGVIVPSSDLLSSRGRAERNDNLPQV